MAKRKSKTEEQLTEQIKEAARSVEKKYKDMPVGTGEDQLSHPEDWISLGALSLDRICRGRNTGGVPIGPRAGRIVHIAGEWSTGKSLILDHLFKSVQEIGGIGVCSETEGSRCPHFAQAIGMDLSKILIMRPSSIEEAFDSFMMFHEKFRINQPSMPILWGIDSLDASEALRTAGVGLTDSGVFHYGAGRSQALGHALRRVATLCSRYPTTLVMLNQTRDKPGVLYGKKKQTPGGNPPHFYASLEIWLSNSPLGEVRDKYQGAKLTNEQRKRLGMRVTERGDVVGRWIRAKIEKTKVSSTPAQEADFYISFTRGVHKWGGLLQRLLHEGLAEMGHKEEVVFGGETFQNEQEWLGWLGDHEDLLEKRKEDTVEQPALETEPEETKELGE